MNNITVEQYNNELEAIKRNKIDLENMLTIFGIKWLKKHYNVELTHDIIINGRLSRAMGRVITGYYGIKSIELSDKIIIDYRLSGDSTNMIGVLKHELIHYALYKLNLPYMDKNKYFKDECIKHNAPLSVKSMMKLAYNYECENGHKIYRNRKIDSNKFICECGSKITFKGKSVKMY